MSVGDPEVSIAYNACTFISALLNIAIEVTKRRGIDYKIVAWKANFFKKFVYSSM